MSETSQVQPSGLNSTLNWRAIGAQLLGWTHHTLVLVGVGFVAAAGYFYLHPERLSALSQSVAQWEALRGGAVADASAAEPAQSNAVAPAPELHLSRAQSAIASWLSRRYNIAPLAMRELVNSAWQAGREEHLDPTLILAVMAVESSFNPFAVSSVGATGLMQVMPIVHEDKFAPYGGVQASIDPKANVRVGAAVLKTAIARGGSLQQGLRMYVGAKTEATSGGYAAKVLGEQARLRLVASGAHVPVNAPLNPAPQAPALVPAEAQVSAPEGTAAAAKADAKAANA
ncbi:membrane-bound lytic murein transglycosylase C precursor [mine drainage metagenome]|uniref:Membrane-bound lytic murein transglycosylase C n=1 Tax=mine drainage metagenome TaxID=410659 RepID=A0A1J5R3H8_9ZZZZ